MIESRPTLSPTQQKIADILGGQISSDLQNQPRLTGEMLDSVMGTERYLETVAQPLLRNFSTYVEPQIRQSFRQGGLFSKARGDAVSRALGDLEASLTTNLAEREWQEAIRRSEMVERALYDIPASQKAALGFTSQPHMENIAYMPQQSSGGGGWGSLIGMGAGLAAGALIPGASTMTMMGEEIGTGGLMALAGTAGGFFDRR